MDPARRCSECGESLAGKGPTAKTCSSPCRSKRSRRLARQSRESGALKSMPEHQKDLSGRVRTEIPDVAHHVIEEELRPVVREAITEDTLRAIQQMVGLTPAAVAAISTDLASENDTIRQRAYSLILKYTVGHQAIVRPEEADAGQTLNVQFNLPRPEQEPETIEAESEVIEVGTRQCDKCGADKPESEFIVGSDRCTQCYSGQQARAKEILEATNPRG